MSENINTQVLTSLQRLEAGQTQVAAKLTQLEAGQTQLAARMTQFEVGQTQVAAELVQLKTTQSRQEVRQTEMEARQTQMGASVIQLRVDLMARMDRLQDSLTTIRDDIAVNSAASDAARRANDNTRAEVQALSEIVSTMMRQIHRLQFDVRTLKGE